MERPAPSGTPTTLLVAGLRPRGPHRTGAPKRTVFWGIMNVSEAAKFGGDVLCSSRELLCPSRQLNAEYLPSFGGAEPREGRPADPRGGQPVSKKRSVAASCGVPLAAHTPFPAPQVDGCAVTEKDISRSTQTRGPGNKRKRKQNT